MSKEFTHGHVLVLVSTLWSCGAEATAPTRPSPEPNNMWRGLVVEAENACAKYNRDRDYGWTPASFEVEIVERMGGRIYGPYTGTYFGSTSETDMEHMIALREAHDSGACAWGTDQKRMFARDLDNLTLASPSVNRNQKSDKDAAEWLPPYEPNRCWFAAQVVAVRRKYSLMVDRREADALESVLSSCSSTSLVFASP